MTMESTPSNNEASSGTSALDDGLCMDSAVKKIMEVKGADGKKHPIYGDDFAAAAITDVLARLNELEAKEAREQGHDA
jgi:hypothetical protein